MSEAYPICLLGSPHLEHALAQMGFEVFSGESPVSGETLQIGAHVRLVILDGKNLGDAQTFDTIKALQECRPYLDVLVFKPDADASYVHAVLKSGAADVVYEDSLETLQHTIQTIQANQTFSSNTSDLRDTRKKFGSFEGILSRNGTMWDIFQTIARTASSDATVLIVGETGTGKDLLARAIHRQSGRTGRFVAVNCSTINPEIIESELFGHERGAFTGAHQQKQGLFRYADGGTILLDEIGDMPVQTQLSLLRVLQEQTVRPVGSHHEVPIDARVIAATNASLAQAVQIGQFREDLFYRLDVIRLEVPPLRERREDILFLFGHFLKQVCADYGMDCPELNQSFMDLLWEQPWPGNVRQLENLTQRLVLKGHTKELTAEDLTEVLYSQEIPGVSSTLPSAEMENGARSFPSQNCSSASIDPTLTLADYLQPQLSVLEKEYLEVVLADNNGRIADSANQAGMSRRTLLRKLKAYDIDKQEFRDKS
ncbi:sigma-54 dependent transcriptional regulator [Candidatus Nitronereus thalassa]|uniref:Sigma-54 dependent transcriptional regulator n=1 Tax=Candidatus Nitronereus thalassa TaxID=3020898 RepID=A0ABU3KBW2_9BACT|nr:sigma-54 dependent transcriptional regulator [Candidatus Nitronereus thalassa]MDT7043878.1 sigma-54 dependent transcriptional regulator [Candidatus Nitronereus thalassa]